MDRNSEATLAMKDRRFPSSRHFLWDRTPAGSGITLRAEDFLPSTEISQSCFVASSNLLSKAGNSKEGVKLNGKWKICDDGKINLRVERLDTPSLPKSRDGEFCGVVHCSKYSDAKQSRAVQTLRDRFQLSMDRSTDNPIISSLFPLRCTCGNTEESQKSTFIHGLLLCPESLVSITPLYPKRVFAVPLAKELKQSMSNPTSPAKAGVLTMEQGRCLIPMMLECALTNCMPLVGIWVSGIHSIVHSVVLYACNMIANTTLHKDKAFQPDGSFLLLCYCRGSETHTCYECKVQGLGSFSTYKFSAEKNPVQCQKDVRVRWEKGIKNIHLEIDEETSVNSVQKENKQIPCGLPERTSRAPCAYVSEQEHSCRSQTFNPWSESSSLSTGTYPAPWLSSVSASPSLSCPKKTHPGLLEAISEDPTKLLNGPRILKHPGFTKDQDTSGSGQHISSVNNQIASQNQVEASAPESYKPHSNSDVVQLQTSNNNKEAEARTTISNASGLNESDQKYGNSHPRNGVPTIGMEKRNRREHLLSQSAEFRPRTSFSPFTFNPAVAGTGGAMKPSDSVWPMSSSAHRDGLFPGPLLFGPSSHSSEAISHGNGKQSQDMDVNYKASNPLQNSAPSRQAACDGEADVWQHGFTQNTQSNPLKFPSKYQEHNLMGKYAKYEPKGLPPKPITLAPGKNSTGQPVLDNHLASNKSQLNPENNRYSHAGKKTDEIDGKGLNLTAHKSDQQFDPKVLHYEIRELTQKVVELQKQMETLLAIHRERTITDTPKHPVPQMHPSEFRVSVNITGESPIHQPEKLFLPPPTVVHGALNQTDKLKTRKDMDADTCFNNPNVDRPETHTSYKDNIRKPGQDECPTTFNCPPSEACITAKNAGNSPKSEKMPSAESNAVDEGYCEDNKSTHEGCALEENPEPYPTKNSIPKEFISAKDLGVTSGPMEPSCAPQQMKLSLLEASSVSTSDEELDWIEQKYGQSRSGVADKLFLPSLSFSSMQQLKKLGVV